MVKAYGYFPTFLSTQFYIDHGPSRRDVLSPSELSHDHSLVFYHSRRLSEVWNSTQSRPSYVMRSPFVFYRERHGIEQDPDARGTVCFPMHSTKQISAHYDVNRYIDELEALPEQFHPIDICMYWVDIKKGRHNPFRERGMNVTTAGHRGSRLFMHRFYEILRSHRFATSNHVGSHLLYAVEMGLPFSIIGPKGFWKNHGGNKDMAPGAVLGHDSLDPHTEAVYRMFQGVHTEITDEQREVVEQDLGLTDCISRPQVRRLLYSHYLRHLASSINRRFASTSG
jgi:hypothetical protein